MDGKATGRKLFVCLVAASFAIALALAGTANAEVNWQFTFGESGSGAGQFNKPAGIAINQATENVYVADRGEAASGNERIQEFTSSGSFIRAWGFDVVKEGEDDKPPANEVQTVRIKADSGTFKLSFGAAETEALPYNAPAVTVEEKLAKLSTIGEPSNEVQTVTIKATSGKYKLSFGAGGPGISDTEEIEATATAAEVEAKLNALTNINTGGGSVTVSGGPGNATGSPPYTVTFGGGPLAKTDVAQLVATNVSLAGGSPSSSAVVATTAQGGPHVSVSGGPGDPTGSTPYIVTFIGTKGGVDQAQLTINQSDLGIAVGTQLNCSQVSVDNPSIAYKWIANGETIPGATSSTYTVAASDAGKVVQCVVLATWGEDTLLEAGVPFQVVSPAPTPAPPIPPPVSSLFNIFGTGSRAVGTPGGSTLTCEANTWTQGPTEYTYRMFRNGQEVGSPTTTTATTNVYTFTTADLSSPADFQCGVTGRNAGGGESTFFSRDARTEPAPAGCCHVFERQTVSVATNGVGTGVGTQVGGGAPFEVCKANPPSTDVCKAGVRGGLLGEFNRPRGIAVDQATGDVYVGDDRNFRVQKFTATGTPIMTFGKSVNKSTGGGTCTAASGDPCGEGLQSKDATPGTFGGWPTGGLESPEGGNQELEFKELGNSVAVDGSGNVYVTDPYLGGTGSVFQPHTRIQKFDSSGNFLGQVFTNGVTSEAKPLAVAADAADNVFTSVGGEQADVVISEPPDFTPEGTEQNFIERHVLHENQAPIQLAVDPTDQKIWLTDRNQSAFGGSSHHVCGEEGNTARRALVAYDLEGHPLDCVAPTGSGELAGRVSGLAISASRLAFVSSKDSNQVKVFKLPPDIAPSVPKESVSRITTETAKVEAEVNPGFEPTSYTLEYGLGDCEVSTCASVPGVSDAYGANNVAVDLPLTELEPNTRYHYRIVAENSVGTGVGADRTFVTFPFVDLVNDPCPNALARKQTRTAGALDCRAYELASANFTGGYDVVSDLVPGQTPFDGYPDAPGRLLYSVRDGGIPGTGNPTNRGPDPYVATRGAEGWTTKYVGIPADDPYATGAFSSTLLGADTGLNTFAFGGPEICSPCFADGSSGVPVRMPNGELVQGMTGEPPDPSATSAGYVAKPLSADGSHLVFGTTAKLVSGSGIDSTSVKLYDRNLGSQTTQLISTLPGGTQITGEELGELDISSDGSRILFGTEVGEDPDGNRYWHLYMHVGSGSSAKSVDLMEAAGTGALFDGMTSDGSKVFFTTTDQLLPEDEDTSADIYVAEVAGAGPATLKLLSAPAAAPEPGNVDTCDPAANGDGNNWNAVGGASANTCGVVAIGGGGGIAGETGVAYFLSPETLGGSGVANEPNLFAVEPGGALKLVATLEPNNALVRDAVKDSELHRYGDFQTTPDGKFAAFVTTKPLNPAYNNAGFAEVYRYELAGNSLSCASCLPTEGSPLKGESSLPSHGLGITDAGSVFFNSADQLVMRDQNEKLDAYEWEDGALSLISTGFSAFPSDLLTVTADGKDAFFFTRETLVPSDNNGQAMKLYDARAGGGFFVIPASPLCAASDECHGPGSQAAPPPPIGTFKGTGGQHTQVRCKKGFVRRHGRCVRKRKHHGRGHHKHSHRHSQGSSR
jgi:hypothetical protein